MVNCGLVVRLVAKEGRGHEVADFLQSAMPLVQAEDSTPAWFAYQADERTFYITDAFASETDRENHLKGPIAAALMKKASDLFAQAPEIIHARILGAKF